MLTIVPAFDQGELEAGGKYQIDRKELQAFIANNPFRPLDYTYQLVSHFTAMGQAGLYPLADTIPLARQFQLKYFSGCQAHTFWLFTINEKTGELWIEIQYPDWQGQGPTCN